MSSPSTLGLFGVIHMDRLGKVTDELDRFVEPLESGPHPVGNLLV